MRTSRSSWVATISVAADAVGAQHDRPDLRRRLAGATTTAPGAVAEQPGGAAVVEVE